MDIDFVSDTNLLPRPRGDVKIEGITAFLTEDSSRVRVEIDITPFAPADRPSLEIGIYAYGGKEVASTHIVETINRKLTLTMHIREQVKSHEPLLIQAGLYYDE